MFHKAYKVYVNDSESEIVKRQTMNNFLII